MDLREFLKAVVTSEEEGLFLLAFAPVRGAGWWEEWFAWPKDLDRILDSALTRAEDANVYFSSYLFGEASSTKSNVLGSRTIQADLDDADLLTLPLKPSVLVQTSGGRHQAYWFLRKALEPDAHEVLSRKLTYSIPGCDTSGWPLGRKVRVPWTFNYKYLEGPQQVQILSSPLTVYDESELELLPDPPNFILTRDDVSFLDSLVEPGSTVDGRIGPQELLNSIKAKLPPSVFTTYNTRQSDRSKALWALLCAGFRAGLGRDEVWWLGWYSANNKFADLKYHAERELAKDVLRAEASVKSKIPDERAEIGEIRKLSGAMHERRQVLLNKVIDFMRASGEFLHTSDDTYWYIRSDLGRPIMVSPASEWLDMVMDLQFGLNRTEQDHNYVVRGLTNFCRSLPVNAQRQALSWYDTNSNALLLHSWRKDVYRVTPTEVQRTTDGSYGVVFPWGVSNEPFTPNLQAPRTDWADVLFRSALDNVIGLDPDAAMAVLKVWTLFLLFRSAAVSRPILAFFGQPGAGKSTLFRRIYTLLYGRQRSLTGITSPENFDHAMAADPFLVLDNVDLPERWLPDRLAVSASPSDITKRKLYTDADDYVVKRQALIGVTAHNPHFNREDVADRLLLLTFSRLKHFVPEGDIVHDIHNQRNRLWGGIVLDAQRVLGTALPTYAQVPQFRIEDFARMGYWISTALGCAEEFTAALTFIGQGQKRMNLEEDHILVSSLYNYSARCKSSDQFKTSGVLWQDLCTYAQPDPQAFQRIYRNAVYLGKKLWSLQDSLKTILDIEWKYDPTKGARVWRINEQSGSLNHLLGGASRNGTSGGHLEA